MNQHVVIEDLARRFKVGHRLSDAEMRAFVARPELCVMPVDQEMVDRDGVGGYVKREFGDGSAIPVSPSVFARLALALKAGPVILHWRARVQLIKQSPKASVVSMRLVADRDQAGSVSCGVNRSTEHRLSSDEDGHRDDDGWVLGGRADVNPTMPGVYGFALHGAGPSYRLLWAALSQE